MILTDQDQINAVYRATKVTTNAPGLLYTLSSLFGVPKTICDIMKSDDSGLKQKPAKGSTTPPERRLYHLVRSNLKKHLTPPKIESTGQTFAERLTLELERAEVGTDYHTTPHRHSFCISVGAATVRCKIPQARHCNILMEPYIIAIAGPCVNSLSERFSRSPRLPQRIISLLIFCFIFFRHALAGDTKSRHLARHYIGNGPDRELNSGVFGPPTLELESGLGLEIIRRGWNHPRIRRQAVRSSTSLAFNAVAISSATVSVAGCGTSSHQRANERTAVFPVSVQQLSFSVQVNCCPTVNISKYVVNPSQIGPSDFSADF